MGKAAILRYSTLLLLPLVGTGCLGNGDDTAGPITGTWSGTWTQVNNSRQEPIIAAFIESGPGFIYDGEGIFYAVSPLHQQRDLQATAISMDQIRSCTGAQGCIQPFHLDGVDASDHIQLSARTVPGVFDGGSPAGTTVFSIQMQPSQPFAQTDPMLAAGLWQGYMLPAGLSATLTMQANGAFTGNDGLGCSFTGALEQVAVPDATVKGLGRNLFKVILQGAFDPKTRKCDGNMIGVGYFTSVADSPLDGTAGANFIMGVYPQDLFSLDITPFTQANGYILEFQVP